MKSAIHQHTNRLVREKSPYLLQHAHNPVDWFAWGDEAFARARAENKPIFLSIGYSTCHWCHVMERESFEDEQVAGVLNEHFVSIKVDREERPDVDKIYMTFVQATTGSGGWPLNVFLTPELKPFFGGTYFPPANRQGRPGFLQLLRQIHEVWQTRRGEIAGSADEIHARFEVASANANAGDLLPTHEALKNAGDSFKRMFDPRHGGFGGAPKFPQPSLPSLLLRCAKRFHDDEAARMVLHTCDRMAAGGIHDPLGGGFARYSVDAEWLVPHFEKMLYDQAQLAQLYLDAHLVSEERVIRDPDSSSGKSLGLAELAPPNSFPFDPFHFERRETPEIELADSVKCGGEQLIRVVVTRATWDKVAPKIRSKDDVKPEAVYEDLNIAEIDPTQDFEINCETQLVTVKDGVNLPAITAFRLLAAKLKRLGRNNPILLKDCLSGTGFQPVKQTPNIDQRSVPLEPKIALLRASVVIGSLLADGIGDAILIRGEAGAGQSLRLAYNLLQAAGCRSFKTDYVACPSCGRTLFNLQTVTARIKARTEHLKGVKIAIMGCIVNGPGEMADADFGYVGGAPGKINLYVGKQAIKFNIPEAEAVDRLVDLIKEHNKWVEPESPV